ncbi:hypothetical protein NPIL_390611 [Nephila pilipes]|uniref:Uncharacterized protein n=1 Tax=Nephila pilipes TaxID=299642 RepID=A0A8X6J0X7_NEPPI|nr:hypothetical protein NPIL_390611 [Nephila pilipes]
MLTGSRPITEGDHRARSVLEATTRTPRAVGIFLFFKLLFRGKTVEGPPDPVVGPGRAALERKHLKMESLNPNKQRSRPYSSGNGVFYTTGKQKVGRCLNFLTGDGASVCCSQTRFGNDTLENVVDEGIHDGYGLFEIPVSGVDLFQDFVDYKIIQSSAVSYASATLKPQIREKYDALERENSVSVDRSLLKAGDQKVRFENSISTSSFDVTVPILHERIPQRLCVHILLYSLPLLAMSSGPEPLLCLRETVVTKIHPFSSKSLPELVREIAQDFKPIFDSRALPSWPFRKPAKLTWSVEDTELAIHAKSKLLRSRPVSLTNGGERAKFYENKL